MLPSLGKGNVTVILLKQVIKGDDPQSRSVRIHGRPPTQNTCSIPGLEIGVGKPSFSSPAIESPRGGPLYPHRRGIDCQIVPLRSLSAGSPEGRGLLAQSAPIKTVSAGQSPPRKIHRPAKARRVDLRFFGAGPGKTRFSQTSPSPGLKPHSS